MTTHVNQTTYYVENLTLRTWLFAIFPRLLWDRLQQKHGISHCYFIDGSWISTLLAGASGLITRVTLKRLDFRLADLKDESGNPLRLRIVHQDLAEVQRFALAEPSFQELVENGELKDRLPIFLAKRITSSDLADHTNMWRALCVIQVSIWQTKKTGKEGDIPVLFLKRRPWMRAISRYASEHGVRVIPVHRSASIRSGFVRRLPAPAFEVLRKLKYRRLDQSLLSYFKDQIWSSWIRANTNGLARRSQYNSELEHESNARVAVDCYGQLNLKCPGLNSDLFFWQQSPLLTADEILLIFSIATQPLDQRRSTELAEERIAAIALHPGATTLAAAPVFKLQPKSGYGGIITNYTPKNRPESAWLNENIRDYYNLREYWHSFFARYNIKVYSTWFKYNASHCAIGDAIQAAGGVSVIHQRAYEAFPSAITATSADIVFAFSPGAAKIERQSNSSIQYHVATGYLGDHRASLVKNDAQEVRTRLKQNGATSILAFFDENSTADARWASGHHVPRQQYAFLLNKVLAEPWLGLVLKPKIPGNLRARLGPVAELLKAAEATGRCYVHEDRDSEISAGWHTPVEAALAADIAVHSDASAATAGLESALAGIPTLLLDQEAWTQNPLHRLGLDQVVFKDWDRLWEACRQYWAHPSEVPGFGDWSPVLDELDPFRDGRAAERMGTYIHWLLEGFNAGLDRETTMADAAERYCALWGKDKISQVYGVEALSYPVSTPADAT